MKNIFCPIDPRTVFIVLATFVTICTVASAQVSPMGGFSDSPIMQGTTTLIKWTTYMNAPSVDIFLWDARTSQRSEIARNVPGQTKEFSWNVPLNLATGTKYRIVVEQTDERYRRVMSPGWVTIGQQNLFKENNEPSADPANNHDWNQTGDANSSAADRMTIAPDPARDVARIRFSTDFQTMRIVSLDGRTLMERILSPGERLVDLQVQSLPAGLYSVVLLSASGRRISSPLHIMP